MGYRKVIETTEELAKWYDEKYKEMGDGWVTPAEECNRHLDEMGVKVNHGKCLLDVGCGAGHFLAQAVARCMCVGIDISEQAVRFCNKRCGAGMAFKADITEDLVGDALEGIGRQFDYITSIGSLEHVVDLGKALDNIRTLLALDGRFYFYCPNELWVHEDQPNERTMKDDEWIKLFNEHGLVTTYVRRWNDNTAFMGVRSDFISTSSFMDAPRITGTKLNVGSGQRPFDRAAGWVNLDSNTKWSPDVVANWNDLSMFESGSMDLVVAHHTIEHVGCGEADPFIGEARRVLKEGGRLLVFVPDMQAIAKRWLTNELGEQLYMTMVYGAFMGDEQDRHRWGWSRQGLWKYLNQWKWSDVRAFDWRAIPGADIAEDWWIIGMECVR